MPFKSEAQRRMFHVLADKGEMSEKTVHEWEHSTPKKVKKNLPYHVKKAASGLMKGVGAGAALGGGLSALRGVSREMDLREQESGKYSPEQLQKARKDRSKYHVARTVAGSAAGSLVGGAAGHYGPKALKEVGDKMEHGVREGFNKGVSAAEDKFKKEWGPQLQGVIDRNVASAPGKAAKGAADSFSGSLKRFGSKILSKIRK